MNNARDNILGNLRRALKRDPDDAEALARVDERLAQRPRGPQPQRAQVPLDEQIDLFEAMATELAATVARIATLDAVPQAVADYLKANNLPSQLRLAPDLVSDELDWASQPLLTVGTGRAEADDAVSVTGVLAAIAETGTLMLFSSPGNPTSLEFMPETHITVVRASQMVGRYEEAWDKLRAHLGDSGLPRSVNLVTGPSRSGDIEQTIQLGAHGPRQLHIIIVDDRAG